MLFCLLIFMVDFIINLMSRLYIECEGKEFHFPYFMIT